MKNLYQDPWFDCFRPNPRSALRFFCWPYAGGGAGFYRAWSRYLPANIEVCGVQLPGHHPRLSVPPYTRLAPLVEATAEAIAPYLNRPFAFFGHSMGALVSFELTRLLRREKSPMPFRLFVSGRRAPQAPDTRVPNYHLPLTQFIEVLRRLDGTPREALESKELMAVMTPILRADFAVCQTYEYQPEVPLACPITAFGGTEDEETADGRLTAWRDQTTASFSSFVFPGGHFFLRSAEKPLLNALRQALYNHGRGTA